MNKLCLLTLFTFLACISEQVDATNNQAQSVLETVKAQLQQIAWHSLQDENDWAYTVETRLDNGNTGNKIQQTKQRFDPSLPLAKQWQLIESDYNEPTLARLADYQQTQLKLSQENPIEGAENVQFVDMATLEKLDENDKQHKFGFTPNLPMFDQEINQKFQGLLIFDGEKQQIVELIIEAQQSFSPRISFKLDSYRLQIRIENHEGVLHVKSIESEKQGSAFFFSSFDEKSTRLFSHFREHSH